jgi:hypothetical protein
MSILYVVHAVTEHGDRGTFGLAYRSLPEAAAMVERVEAEEFGKFAETWVEIKEVA